MISCIVIDDEQTAINIIAEFISNVPNLSLVNSFTSSLEALNYLRSAPEIDIVFMDVDMPVLNGIELSSLIRESINKLVFTTSHAQCALDAFKVHADGFLLKPFSFADLLNTIEKFFPESKICKEKKAFQDDYLYIKSKEDDLKLVKVEIDDVVAIEGLLNYVRIHTVNNKLVTHVSLKDMKEILIERKEFIQLHRSFIVSQRHISMIDGNTLTTSSGAKFTIGDSYKKTLNELLSRKILKSVSKK